ncbi:MAG: arylsulfatase, partial [Planctomycetota bacterium]|nr:arylsulfatase [Planctomycetota bacterium]
GSSAIRQGDWKLVRGNSRYNKAAWELYNIAEDRCETNNRIHSMPAKAQALQKLWTQWAARMKIQQ